MQTNTQTTTRSQNLPNTRQEVERSIRPHLGSFRKIDLAGMASVSLMQRIDSKYWFHATHLGALLAAVSEDYDLLEIKGESIQSYETFYYDTPANDFYLDHQNERPHRLKIRKRAYLQSHLRFLEVKRKAPNGRTNKTRITIDDWHTRLPASERSFLQKEEHQLPDELEETIRNRFSRITLANRNRRERCTIDFDLQFFRTGQHRALSHIVVVELKQGDRRIPSPLRDALHARRLQPGGFSKYCIGRALLEPELKRNRLKPALRKIDQLENN